jgi:hypothetical protein
MLETRAKSFYETVIASTVLSNEVIDNPILVKQKTPMKNILTMKNNERQFMGMGHLRAAVRKI